MKRCVILLMAASCLCAQDVDTQFDDSVDFGKYKTFRILEGDLNAKAPALNNDLVRKKIENEIRRRLTEKKLTETTAQPDLGVRYTLGAARRNDLNVIRGPRGRAVGTVRTASAEGTLTIGLFDAATRELVWQATAVEEESNPAKVEDRLDEMVKKSFDKYPPKK